MRVGLLVLFGAAATLLVGEAGSTVPKDRKPARALLQSAARCRQSQDCTTRFASLDRSRCNEAGRQVIVYDLNQDGRTDMWKMYETVRRGKTEVRVMTCKKLDLNFDGVADLTGYYDRQERLELEELDLDFDGDVDQIVVQPRGKTPKITHTVGSGTACVNERCVLSTTP
jgi:hypothetical protein